MHKSCSLELRPETAEVLRSHRAKQAELRLAAGPLWQGRAFIFAYGVGRPLEHKRIERAFHRICRKAGIPKRSPSKCRRAFGPLAPPIQGVRAKVVQEGMGHSSIAITLDIYSHLVPDLQGNAMSHLDRLFG